MRGNPFLIWAAAPFAAAMLLLFICEPAVAQQSSYERNTDRPGLDFRNFDLRAADPEACQKACITAQECRAWTYVRPGVQGPTARCWLKSAVPNKGASDCCVSGVIVGRSEVVGPAAATVDADRDRHSRAIAEHSEAIRRDPIDASAYRNRAIAHEKLGQNADAISDYRKALLLDPSDKMATEGLKRLGATPF